MIRRNRYRTHSCGQLSETDIGQVVRLSGFLHKKRDLGGVLFLDLRDQYGLTQVVIEPQAEFFEQATHLRLESVLTIEGEVIRRDEENINPKLPTGRVEIVAKQFQVESESEQIPFQVAHEEKCAEELRLRYRFLDLRKERMKKNILLRSQLCQRIRSYLTARGFFEFQTPILTSSSPEGARDFLVPSRLHPGQFYALPQAPQQFKQLIIQSGFDRYFQIAPCFRDEDSRADRSPGEFYQLDLEMAFAEQEDVFELVEGLMVDIYHNLSPKQIQEKPFPKIPYREAIERFGTDKPDLRTDLEFRNVEPIFAQSSFRVFTQVLADGGIVKAIRLPEASTLPRSFFDRAVDKAVEWGSQGLAWLLLEEDGFRGPIAKFLPPEPTAQLIRETACQVGDALFFAAGRPKETNQWASQLRLYLAQETNRIDPQQLAFCWIVDYPMFEFNEAEGRIDFSHNPFSMPQGGLEALTSKDPLDILAYQYDIVCNGIELSSGAIRNHRPEIMAQAFEIAGYTQAELECQFPALYRAFHFGAVPHGGLAPGIDRMLMILADEPNIREVIAFPLNQKAQDLLMGAPNKVTKRQLQDVHIQLSEPE